MALSWQYIAGFFDGEGNVRIAHGTSPQLSLHQADTRGLKLLSEIKLFLESYGIKCNIHKNKLKTGLGKDMYRLYTYNRHGVLTFIRHTMPYLHIKKVECQDIARYLTIFPSSHGNVLFRRPHVPRTHCRLGHELTPDNVYLGGRVGHKVKCCKICAKAKANEYYLRVKVERFVRDCTVDERVRPWL